MYFFAFIVPLNQLNQCILLQSCNALMFLLEIMNLCRVWEAFTQHPVPQCPVGAQTVALPPQIHAIAEMCSLALSLHSFTGTEKKPVGHELSAQVWKYQHVFECVLHFMLPSEWPAASQQREAQGWMGGLCERAASQSCRGGGRSHKSGWMAEATVCSDGEGLGKVYHNLSDPQMLLFPDQDRIGWPDHGAYHWSCRKEHWN